MQTEAYIELENKYGVDNYCPLDVVLTRGEGAWVWDTTGKRYLDCLSAYSALNQGHRHPRIVRALIKQAQKLTLTSRAFRNDQLPLLERELCELTGYDRMLPMNSGAEAVETALKAARLWGDRVKSVPENQANIIVCEQCFHGRTITLISFSSTPCYKNGFGPFTPGFEVIPYGNSEALDAAITPNTIAFIVEPFQGEAGVQVPPTGYMRQVRELCDRHNVLLIADEVQTGLGRTGRFMACDWEKVKPDLTVIGKALSGGIMPVSAVVGTDEVLSLFTPGSHGSTFGGNPLGCAVAREALRVIVEEHLPERADELGTYFIQALRDINSPYVKEIRGKGLLIGVELKAEVGSARPFCEQLRDRGVLAKETHGNVIRLAPPLIIDREDLNWALEHIRAILTPTRNFAS